MPTGGTLRRVIGKLSRQRLAGPPGRRPSPRHPLGQCRRAVRWRLWHGRVKWALDLLGTTVNALDAVACVTSPAGATADKVAKLLRSLETYMVGQPELIIGYAAVRHDAEPISTAPTESTVQWLLQRRMGAKQQMRRSPRGAHMMLKVRTAVANGTFERDYVAAERGAQRPSQRAGRSRTGMQPLPSLSGGSSTKPTPVQPFEAICGRPLIGFGP